MTCILRCSLYTGACTSHLQTGFVHNCLYSSRVLNVYTSTYLSAPPRAGVGTRLAGVGTRLAGVGTRLAGVGTRQAGVGTRLTGVGTRLAGVGTRLAGVGTRQSLGY